MCGIIGVITSEGSNGVVDHILTGLDLLRNRGYDSCGIGLLSGSGEDFVVKKFGSTTTSNAHELLSDAFVTTEMRGLFDTGIGHNRWATHGPKTDINAHPHVSLDGRFMVVHNGIIENYAELKRWLTEEHGYAFVSQTDTEVIVALISVCAAGAAGAVGAAGVASMTTSDCIRWTLKRLVGTYGIVVVNRDEPGCLYCVRSGSPLLVGNTGDLCIVTSEQSGFHNQVHTYITLENDDICVISKSGAGCGASGAGGISVKTGCSYQEKAVSCVQRLTSPSPYEHWTIREIHEQPMTIMNGLNHGGRIMNEVCVKLGGLDQHVDMWCGVDHLVLLGCGSSYNAATYCAHLFKTLCRFHTVQAFDGGEMTRCDIPKCGKVAFVLVSQSGETRDLHRCIDIARENSAITIGVVNVVDSLIAREVDCGVYCNSGVEVGVASTKSFTSQVLCLSLVAVWFSQIQDENVSMRRAVIHSLRNLSNDYADTLEMCCASVKSFVPSFLSYQHVFLLGKGADASLAHEAALKIKEITYTHAEGHSSGSLKHGPFALLDEHFLVILLKCGQEHARKTESCYQEIRTRGAPVLTICDYGGNGGNGGNEELSETDKVTDTGTETIYVKRNAHFGGLLALIPLQLLSYYVAIAKGINPDTPKNLAKVVTVE